VIEKESQVATVVAQPAALPQSAGPGLHLVVFVVALLGGGLGIAGAFVGEMQRGGLFLLPVLIGAPVIEEALKPAGVYIALLRWPQALRSQLYIAALCALGGLVFALIESAVYTQLYFPDAGDDFVMFRFTIPVAMHVICSFVYGFGVNHSIIDWAAGRGRLARSTRRAYITAAGIHGTYNLVAVVLSVSGVLDFEE
jgi:RsiW-degrading membrane proteinase PrsW (M82 family)